MNILVTGAKGFVGKNLIAELRHQNLGEVYAYDLDTGEDKLDDFCRRADFVFHLAGVNRPQQEEEYMRGNFGFTSTLLETLKKYQNKAPVVLASSIQAELDNPYGQSKRAGERLLFDYGRQEKVTVLVYRFANLFGKWCRPNYNSVVATFCYNKAHGLPIVVNDPSKVLPLCYIDDVVEELLRALRGEPTRAGEFCEVPVTEPVSLGRLAGLLEEFVQSRATLAVPDMRDDFTRKLYATYLSYLPTDQFSYPLKQNVDERGSFTEFLRTPERGQVSVNVAHPGVVKGNHWHHTKNEKFLVVSGKGLIRFRKVGETEVYEYHVSGEKLTVVDIPTGYTHSIANEGEGDLVTVMWASEPFDPQRPDTYFEPV